MAELGALEAMAVLGALETMVGAGSSGGHGRWSSGALASVPSARPLQPEPLLTPPKFFPGEVRGYQKPSGARHTEQDRTAHRNQKPSWAGLEAEASSGHDQESEAHTGSLSDCLHINDKGAGG